MLQKKGLTFWCLSLPAWVMFQQIPPEGNRAGSAFVWMLAPACWLVGWFQTIHSLSQPVASSYIKQSSLSTGFRGSVTAHTFYLFSNSGREIIRDVSSGALSINAKHHGHSLDLSTQHQVLVQMTVFQGYRRLLPSTLVCEDALSQGATAVQYLMQLDASLMIKVRYGGSSLTLQIFLRAVMGTHTLHPVPGTFSLISGLLPNSCRPEKYLWVGSLPRALCTGVASGNYLLDPNCTICGNPLCTSRHVCLSRNA